MLILSARHVAASFDNWNVILFDILRRTVGLVALIELHGRATSIGPLVSTGEPLLLALWYSFIVLDSLGSSRRGFARQSDYYFILKLTLAQVSSNTCLEVDLPWACHCTFRRSAWKGRAPAWPFSRRTILALLSPFEIHGRAINLALWSTGEPFTWPFGCCIWPFGRDLFPNG